MPYPPLHATQTDTSQPEQIQSFDDLPQGLAYAISSALQDKLPSTYSLNRAQSGFLAKNPAHTMNFTFTDKGPRVTNKNNIWQWSMTLIRWGRSESLRKAPLGTMTVKGPRMEYKRGASLSEWYMNTPWGMEQGFTITHRPPTPDNLTAPLILELTLSGTLQPALRGNTLLLSDSTGHTRIRYTGLYDFDKEGKTLASRLALKGDTLRITISEYIKEEILKKIGLDKDRVTAIPLAPDPLFYPRSPGEVEALRRARNWPREYLLFVGSLEPRKNLPLLIKALGMVKTTIPLIMAGWEGWGDKPWMAGSF